MTGPGHHEETSESGALGQDAFPYPKNHLLGVVDDRERAASVVAALTSGGFLRSEIHIGTGAATADALDATTGRSGLAAMLTRLAEKIGVTNEEIEAKNQYEEAMRNDRFVIAVAAPTDDRKARALQVLQQHGAHTIAYFGSHTIEHVAPPSRR